MTWPVIYYVLYYSSEFHPEVQHFEISAHCGDNLLFDSESYKSSSLLLSALFPEHLMTAVFISWDNQMWLNKQIVQFLFKNKGVCMLFDLK